MTVPLFWLITWELDNIQSETLKLWVRMKCLLFWMELCQGPRVWGIMHLQMVMPWTTGCWCVQLFYFALRSILGCLVKEIKSKNEKMKVTRLRKRVPWNGLEKCVMWTCPSDIIIYSYRFELFKVEMFTSHVRIKC